MTQQQFKHVTVLLDEAVNGLNIKPNGIYIDGTFGRGGHSRLILSQLNEQGRLIAIDRDPEAIKAAQEIDDPRFMIKHGPFSAIAEYVEEEGLVGKIDGVLLDLGVSSPNWMILSVVFHLCVMGRWICVWINERAVSPTMANECTS